MPEPERDIEKTLRAYAKKRREEAGAPAEMHPATRRLLQGEVARLRGKPREKSGFWEQVFGRTWPQMALRVSVFALLASVAAVILLPNLSKPKVEFQMAAVKPRDEQITMEKRLLKKETDGGSSLQYNKSPAEEPARRKTIVGLSGDLPAAKQDGLAGSASVNGNAPVAGGGRAFGGEAQFVAKVAPPVSGLEKDKFATDSVSLGSLKSTQAASGALDGAVTITNGLPELSIHAGDVKLENSNAKSTSNFTVWGAPSGAPANRQSNLFASGSVPAASPTLAPSPAAAAAPPIGSLVEADRAASGINAETAKAAVNSVTQQFARADQPAGAQKALKRTGKVVLNSFRVVQTGNQIQVIDSDGSIYSGFVGQAEEGAKPSGARAEGVAAAGDVSGGKNQTKQYDSVIAGAPFQAVPNNFFRVSGTNRSIKQLVVFTGQFVPNPPVSPSAKLSASNALSENESLAPQAGPAPFQLLNSQLQGRAVVGSTNQIEIIALPVKH